MSRFMSHREMKAATRVVGNIADRLALLERIISELLERDNLALGMVNGKFTLVDRATIQNTPDDKPELEMRVIEDEADAAAS